MRKKKGKQEHQGHVHHRPPQESTTEGARSTQARWLQTGPAHVTAQQHRQNSLIAKQRLLGNSFVRREIIQRRSDRSHTGNVPRDLGEHRGTQELAGPASFKDLALSGALTGRAPVEVSDFIWEYNLFLQPLRMTAAALGRVQDLTAAGVPFAPAMMSDEQKNSLIDPAQIEEGISEYTDWAQQQVNVERIFNNYLGNMKLLKGALYQLESARATMAMHLTQAQLANKGQQLEKIRNSARRLKKIVDYVQLGYNYANKLDGLLGFQAAGDKLSPGNIDVAEGAAGEIWSQATANEGITVALLVVASGQAEEYLELEKEIRALKGEIAFLNDQRLDQALQAAEETVVGWKLKADPGQVSNLMAQQVTFARHRARDFAVEAGGDLATANIMMMAEAFQELATFGSSTLKFMDSTGLDAKARMTLNYLSKNFAPFFRGRSPAEKALDDRNLDFDFLVLDIRKTYRAGKMVFAVKGNLEQKVPLWTGFARQWRFYLSDLVGRSFRPGE